MEIKKGLFYDDKGNFSSGRVVKMTSIFLAIATSLTGLGALLFMKAPNMLLSDYCFKMTGLFLATATGAEIVQKTTGR